MDRDAVEKLFFERLQTLSPEAEYELRDPEYMMEMAAIGKRIRGRDKMRALQQAFAAPPTFRPRRVAGSGDVFVVEGAGDYGGQIFHVVDMVEFRDDKIARETQLLRRAFRGSAMAGALDRADERGTSETCPRSGRADAL